MDELRRLNEYLWRVGSREDERCILLVVDYIHCHKPFLQQSGDVELEALCPSHSSRGNS
ncbi:MAG: hypothetical protein WHX93_02970 [bacterium]